MTIIKEIRESCGLTTTEVSRLTGIPNTTVWDLENGKVKNPNPANIDKIMDLLAERIELAYVAGLVDRACSITITKNQPAIYNCHEIPHYVAKFMVVSKHREVPEIIKRVLGTGSVSKQKYIDRSGTTLIRYCYYAFSAQSYAAIYKIFPYLKLKRAKAKVLLEFREYMDKQPYGKHLKPDWDADKHIETCEKFYKAIREA